MIVPNERFDDPALFSGGYCQAGGRDFSKFWPIALILSSVFKEDENKEIRKLNAKAMTLFMKYSQ